MTLRWMTRSRPLLRIPTRHPPASGNGLAFWESPHRAQHVAQPFDFPGRGPSDPEAHPAWGVFNINSGATACTCSRGKGTQTEGRLRFWSRRRITQVYRSARWILK